MPHAITTRTDGKQEFFSAGTTPVWHRVGQRVPTALTSAAALKMAALDWQVESRALTVAAQDARQIDVSTHKAIVRTDNQKVLGVVGSRYEPVQNRQTFEWLDEVIGPGKAVYETAGSLHGGSVVWALVRLPGELRIKGTDDLVHPYILVVNSHDGSIAFRAMNTSVRVVCQNTLTIALRQAGPDSISVKHTESIHDRLADAQEVLGLAISKHQLLEQQMNRLAQTPLRKRAFTGYLDRVFGARADPERDEGIAVSAARAQVTRNFDDRLQRLRGIEHTAWAAFNAVSQYVDWERPTRGVDGRAKDERRFESTLLGSGAELKRKAWSEALRLVRLN